MSARSRQQSVANGRRLRSTITRLEQQPYWFVPPMRGPRVPMQLALCHFTTTISARTGTTAGSGSAALVTFDGTNLADSGTTVPVSNFAAASIASGKYGVIGSFGNAWFVVSAEC